MEGVLGAVATPQIAHQIRGQTANETSDQRGAKILGGAVQEKRCDLNRAPVTTGALAEERTFAVQGKSKTPENVPYCRPQNYPGPGLATTQPGPQQGSQSSTPSGGLTLCDSVFVCAVRRQESLQTTASNFEMEKNVPAGLWSKGARQSHPRTRNHMNTPRQDKQGFSDAVAAAPGQVGADLAGKGGGLGACLGERGVLSDP